MHKSELRVNPTTKNYANKVDELKQGTLESI